VQTSLTNYTNSTVNPSIQTSLTNYTNSTVNPSIQTSLTNYTNNTLPTTLRTSTLYCPDNQAYCSLSNTKAGTDSIVARNGNIGIGTINPLEELHINRTTATNALTKYTNSNTTTTGGLDVGVDSTGNGVIFHRDTNRPITISTNNAERMRVSEGGNVGIGTTSPTHRLDVNGNINASGNITSSGFITSNGNINSSGNITSNGNIGIGVTVPTQRLSIGPLTSSTDVIAMSLPNNWYIKMKGATITNPAGQLCFSNGNTAATSVDYVCIDPTKTS
jgi:hypothetical protein